MRVFARFKNGEFGNINSKQVAQAKLKATEAYNFVAMETAMAHAQSSKPPSSSASAAAAVTKVVRETSHQLLWTYLKTVQAALDASNAASNVEQDSQSFEQMRSNVSRPRGGRAGAGPAEDFFCADPGPVKGVQYNPHSLPPSPTPQAPPCCEKRSRREPVVAKARGRGSACATTPVLSRQPHEQQQARRNSGVLQLWALLPALYSRNGLAPHLR